MEYFGTEFVLRPLGSLDYPTQTVSFWTLSQLPNKKNTLSRKNYQGGLKISFLNAIGVNLDGPVSRRDMECSAQSKISYNEKAKVARDILENTPPRNMESVVLSVPLEPALFPPLCFHSFILHV